MRLIKVLCCRRCPYFVENSHNTQYPHSSACGYLIAGRRTLILSNTDKIQDWCPLDTPQTAGFVEASKQKRQPRAVRLKTPTFLKQKRQHRANVMRKFKNSCIIGGEK